jgi:hypothetical protein
VVQFPYNLFLLFGDRNKKIKRRRVFLAFSYKGRSLVRSGDRVFYGNVSEDYITEIILKDNVKVKGIKVGRRSTVNLVRSLAAARGSIRPVKTCERSGLFEAIDIADVWLERKTMM